LALSSKAAVKTFLGISSFQILAMFRRGLFYAYLSIFLRHFIGLSVTETTLFATVPMVLNILSQTLVWGRLSDRYQLRRTFIITGELLAAIGTVLIWYAYRAAGTPKLAGTAIIAGLGFIEIFWSMSNIGWSALISDIYPQEQRTAVQGKLTSIGGLGRMAGIWIGGLLYDGLGLKYAGWGFDKGALWFVAAGVMLISIIPMMFVPEGGAGAAPDLPSEASAEAAPAGGYGNAFALFLLAMVFINFGRNSIAVILTQYLVLDSGLAVTSHEVSYIVNTQTVAIIITGLVSGWLSKILGDARALLFGTATAIIPLLILAFTLNLGLVYGSNLLRGVSDVLVLAASYSLASQLIPPEQRGRLFGWFNATFFLSWGVAGTLIAGPVVDLLLARGKAEVFAYQMAFLSAALITLVGFFMLLSLLVKTGMLNKKRRRSSFRPGGTG
jgi:MFS family permease